MAKTLAKKAVGSGVAFTYEGVDVMFDDNRLVSLTDMWKAAGSPKKRRPTDWAAIDSSKEFMASVAQDSNTAPGGIWKSRRGKLTGGVFAHWQVALAYGKYLSPEFHQYVNAAFKEWSEEKANPSLKIERGVDLYLKRGYTEEWVADRCQGIVQRKALTATMVDHNAKIAGADNPFAEATRSISLQVLGKTPSEIKAAKGLPKTAKTRDHLDRRELAALRFAESEAEHTIKAEGADGNAECVDCCRRAGRAVKLAIDSMKRPALALAN